MTSDPYISEAMKIMEDHYGHINLSVTQHNDILSSILQMMYDKANKQPLTIINSYGETPDLQNYVSDAWDSIQED